MGPKMAQQLKALLRMVFRSKHSCNKSCRVPHMPGTVPLRGTEAEGTLRLSGSQLARLEPQVQVETVPQRKRWRVRS